MSSFSPLNHESPEADMSGVRMNLKSSFDSLVENKVDSMKVYCRVRPMLQSEEDFGYTECIAAINDQVVRAIAPSSSVKFKNTSNHGQEIMEDFKYTLAFGPEVGQFSFFQETIMDIMQGFIEGQNGLIFSYGITNSGKTYTLQGDETNPGIIPLSLHLFFACVEHQLLTEISVKPDKYSEIIVLSPSESAKEQRLKEQLLQIVENESGNKSDSASTTKSFGMTLCDAFYDSFKFEERQTTLLPEDMMAAQSALYMKELGKKSAEEQAGLCSIWISFIEIYNEYIYDLLQPVVHQQRQKLSLAEDQNGDVYVKGAREICISSSEEAIKLLKLGRRNLRIASTKLNYQSSRSHCIYTLKVVRLFDEENSSSGRINRISFCDLAGSERAAKSQTSGLRLKEAGYINTSLLVLGRCLDQLRLNQTSRDKKMIPYRESKLTRLFYSHFLGKGKATMIANASPCEQTYDETLNVLRFSAHAKELTLNDSYVSMAFNSLQNLTTQWGQSRTRSIADASADQSSDFDTSLSCEIQEKDEIIEKLLDLADNLAANLKKEKKEKVELEIILRQKICSEFSALSDQLLENQRGISEQRIQSIKDNFQTRIENMEKMYQDQIRQLQLEESCSDESIYQSDEKNDKSSIEIDQENELVQSLQIDQDLKKQEVYQEDVHSNFTNTSSEYEKLISENKSLKLDLSNLRNELDSTTEQLQGYAVMIVDLQNELKQYEESAKIKTENVSNIKMEQSDAEIYKSEINSLTEELKITNEKLQQSSQLLKQSVNDEAIANDNFDALKCKFEEANQVLEQYKNEFDELKLDLITKERDQLQLIEEKQNLKEKISSLSEQLLKTECGLKCEQVKDELEETRKLLEKKNSEVSDLESERNNYKNNNVKLVEDNKAMEEQFTLMSKEMEKTIPEEQYNELDSKYQELTRAFGDQQLKLETATEALKEQKLQFDKTISEEQYNELISKYNDVSRVSEDKMLKLETMTNALRDQKLQFSELESECTTAKENYKKLSDEHDDVVNHFSALKEELDTECNDLKTINIKLVDENKALEKQLALLSSEIGKTIPEEKYNELDSKYKELSQAFDEQQLKLETMTKALKEQELQLSKLESEYTATKVDYNKLSDEHDDLVKQSNNLKELESECNNYKNNNMKLLEDKKALKEQLVLLSKETGKNVPEEKYNELVSKYQELSCTFEDQRLKLETATEALKEQKLLFSKLESECSAAKENNKKLSDDYNNLSEKLNNIKEELERKNEMENKTKSDVKEYVAKLNETNTTINGLTSELQENNRLLENEQSKLLKLEMEYSKYKNESKERIEEHESLYKKFSEMKEELNAAKLQIESLEKEKALSGIQGEDTVDIVNELKIKLEESNQTVDHQKLKITELENKCNDFCSKLEIATSSLENEKSTFEELTLALKAELSPLKSELDKVKKELGAMHEENEQLKNEKINGEQLHATSMAELQTTLELSEKQIKELQETIQVYKNEIAKLKKDMENLESKQEILDLKRQVKEKEASIDELEKAISDDQKVKKENEAQLQKQISSLKHQHSIEIEEIMHLKRICEEENIKLKSTLTQVENKKDEGSNEQKIDTGNKSKTKKGNSKKVDTSKEGNEEALNKAVTKQRRTCRTKQDNVSEDTATETKRRRPLRGKAVQASEELEEDDDFDEDIKPTKGLRKRKSDEKEYKPTIKKTKKRLEGADENMSPVQKALSYVGAKFRKVAESVSAPSPRVTRGRKKLFNVEAEPSAAPKWKL